MEQGSATIVFFPEGAYGPTNNCVGIGQVLRDRGHRVVFVLEESFAGTPRGAGLRGAAAAARAAPRGRGGAGPVLEGLHPRDGARLPASRRSSSSARSSSRRGARSATGRATATTGSRRSSTRCEPDVDGRGQRRLLPGARAQSGRPWARIVSCNPLELKDPGLPPVFSGYPGRRPVGVGRRSATTYAARDRRAPRRVQRVLRGARRRSAARRRRSCPSRTGSTSTSIPTRSTTRASGRSARPGIGSTRASAEPTRRRSSSRPRSRRARARSSTSRSARSARPTSS